MTERAPLTENEVRYQNAALDAENQRLRKGIQDYLDGDYEPKVKKMEKCPHGLYGYEACENCIDKHFADLLRPGETAPQKSEG